MIKGTTPTHIFTLPFDVTENVKEVEIAYAQGNQTKVKKSIADCTMEGRNITTKLTQAETLLFKDGECIEVQIRVLTNAGEVLGSRVMRVHCEKCLTDEVLQ